MPKKSFALEAGAAQQLEVSWLINMTQLVEYDAVYSG